MIQTTIVRGVELGAGVPKICAPVVGKTRQEILAQAQALTRLPVDICEWRCDWYEDVLDPQENAATLMELRQVLGDMPLLMTFRTAAEGGEAAISPEDYTRLLCAGAETGYIDLLDVELFLGREVFSAIRACAKAQGVKIIASNHDFHATPAKEEIISRLCRMQDWGADVAKIAVMPTCSRDVLTLLDATCTMREDYAKIPLITMSMSGTGVVSRLAGEEFGSAMTFGAAEAASAPGQVEVQKLAQVLALLHQAKG
jgi:3-dehydroquinate dehydratase-1